MHLQSSALPTELRPVSNIVIQILYIYFHFKNNHLSFHLFIYLFVSFLLFILSFFLSLFLSFLLLLLCECNLHYFLKNLFLLLILFFLVKIQKVPSPGIEPGAQTWKACMLPTTPQWIADINNILSNTIQTLLLLL